MEYILKLDRLYHCLDLVCVCVFEESHYLDSRCVVIVTFSVRIPLSLSEIMT